MAVKRDGARPLRRLIQSELETRIRRALIAGDILDRAKITVDYDGTQLTVKHVNPVVGEVTDAAKGIFYINMLCCYYFE